MLELTLSVVGGFREAIVEKVRGFNPDLVIEPAYSYETGESDGFISMTPELDAVLSRSLPEDMSPVLSMQYPAVLKTPDNFAAVVLNAFGDAHDFSFEKGNVIAGRWPGYDKGEGYDSLVISRQIAASLGLSAGDKIDCYFFVDGNIKARKPVIGAIYESNFGETDGLVAYASLPWLQKVGGIDSASGTRIDINVAESLERIPAIAEQLQTDLIVALQTGEISKVYPVDNVSHKGAIYFNWLDLLDTNVIVIFILMACVSGFTLISSLFILILQRVRTIGLLRSLGMRVTGVRNVFVYMALKVVLQGMLAGNALGLGIIFAQKYLHFLPLDPDMYYLAYVPVTVSVASIIWLNAGVVAAAWLVMIIPARLVATVRPSQTMQYE